MPEGFKVNNKWKSEERERRRRHDFLSRTALRRCGTALGGFPLWSDYLLP